MITAHKKLYENHAEDLTALKKRYEHHAKDCVRVAELTVDPRRREQYLKLAASGPKRPLHSKELSTKQTRPRTAAPAHSQRGKLIKSRVHFIAKR